MHHDVAWDEGSWFNPPTAVTTDGDALVVTAAEGSDLWRTTSYGFVHDNGHGLLRPFEQGSAVEVSFVMDFDQQFDQAGVLVREDEAHWLKTGTEFADGEVSVGAVSTVDMSDWSLAPVPAWRDATVTVRVSWQGDALTVRARSHVSPWQLVRLAPWTPTGVVSAGPYLAAPSRSGLRVRFVGWRTGPADASLHDDA